MQSNNNLSLHAPSSFPSSRPSFQHNNIQTLYRTSHISSIHMYLFFDEETMPFLLMPCPHPSAVMYRVALYCTPEVFASSHVFSLFSQGSLASACWKCLSLTGSDILLEFAFLFSFSAFLLSVFCLLYSAFCFLPCQSVRSDTVAGSTCIIAVCLQGSQSHRRPGATRRGLLSPTFVVKAN